MISAIAIDVVGFFVFIVKYGTPGTDVDHAGEKF
jgi:hypothetical protein